MIAALVSQVQSPNVPESSPEHRLYVDVSGPAAASALIGSQHLYEALYPSAAASSALPKTRSERARAVTPRLRVKSAISERRANAVSPTAGNMFTVITAWAPVSGPIRDVRVGVSPRMRRDRHRSHCPDRGREDRIGFCHCYGHRVPLVWRTLGHLQQRHLRSASYHLRHAVVPRSLDIHRCVSRRQR